MTIASFILDNKWVLLAYLILAIIIYLNRKKFIVENKVFLLYKTKHGVDYIHKVADKNKEFIKILGYIAIGIGFVGMVFIKGLYDLFFVPSAPATVSLVIPGIQIPGSPIKIPFVYGILALFVVILFHEFGHGVVARANGIKIKSTGIGILGPLPLAFVEPDEKQVTKASSHVQHSIFAAGPFFNILLCVVVYVVIALIGMLIVSMVTPQGVYFSEIQKGYAAETYGVEANVTYNMLNGIQINTSSDLADRLSCLKPNDTVVIANDDKKITMIASQKNDSAKGYLGVAGVKTKYKLKSESPFYKTVFDALLLLTNPFAQGFAEYTFLQWIFTLSLGIGLANLLPLGPVDGGRMLNTALIDIKGKEKGTKLWAQISWLTLAVMLILLLVPIFKAIVLKV